MFFKRGWQGRLAQLVRALVSHTRGHWFESSTAHHLYEKIRPGVWRGGLYNGYKVGLINISRGLYKSALRGCAFFMLSYVNLRG